MDTLINLLVLAAAAGASPVAQGITAAIPPSGTAPAQCKTDYQSRFGIAVMSAAVMNNGASNSAVPVTQINDGQIQATTATPVVPVTQISDGQVQATTATPAPSMTMMGVSQIADGQIQGPACTPSAQVADGQMGCTRVNPVGQISDGQIQNSPTVTVQTTTTNTVLSTATVINQIPDGQIQNPSATAVNQIPDGQIQNAGGLNNGRVACQESTSLELKLDGGVLTDAMNRTGYIASNRQLQFDDPPQTGAIYTAGFSLCSNGSVALGGTTTFYQCRSGGFYNLYDESIASYCEPVTINAVDLIDCDD